MSRGDAEPRPRPRWGVQLTGELLGEDVLRGSAVEPRRTVALPSRAWLR